MKSLTEYPNIGKVLACELNKIGIDNIEELIKIGSAEAVFEICIASDKGCINMLYALEGAIKGIRWHDLSKEQKTIVKNQFEELKKEKETI
jgi:DNA transformation protein